MTYLEDIRSFNYSSDDGLEVNKQDVMAMWGGNIAYWIHTDMKQLKVFIEQLELFGKYDGHHEM